LVGRAQQIPVEYIMAKTFVYALFVSTMTLLVVVTATYL